MKTTRFHAAWVLPIVAPPIRDGWVTVRDGRVVDVGTGRPGTSRGVGADVDSDVDEIDLGRVAILPGLVNAHTHLELSWLWGRVAPAASLMAWVSQLMATRAQATQDDPAAIVAAVASLEESGTAAVGDISNTLASVPALMRGRVDAVVFRELIGFRAADPDALVAKARADAVAAVARARDEIAAEAVGRNRERDARDVSRAGDSSAPADASDAEGARSIDRAQASEPARRASDAMSRVRVALAPHAPYSVSPALFQAIAREAAAGDEPSSVHLGESLDELRFLRDGDGPCRDLLERVGAWNPSWDVPHCRPVDYLSRLGVSSSRLLVVHGVLLDDDELRMLARSGATLVTCPRSNVWVGSGNPPIERFYASGVRVAIGTDSLASATDLNLFSELALLHHLAPALPASHLLSSATRVGARALGFDDLGFIGAGARARLIAVDLPIAIRDVESYLVEGIDPGQIAWVPVGDAQP